MKKNIKKNNITSNKELIEKLYLEGRAQDNYIEHILLYKKPKVLKYNPNYKSKSEDSGNKNYNKTLELIHNFNRKFIKNINTYNTKKDENNKFIKGYKKYKKTNIERMYIKDIDKKNYVFGHLLNSYDKKGLHVPDKFFHRDIYKTSGILISKKNKINDYFEQEITRNGDKRKGKKALKFLKKLTDEVEEVYKKRKIELKNKSNETTSNENEEDEPVGKLRNKINKDDLFEFFEKLSSFQNEIKKEENDIEKLKELISIEENKYNLLHNKKTINITNKNSSKNFIESYNYYKNNYKKQNTKVYFNNEKNMMQNTFMKALNLKKSKTKNFNNNSFYEYTSSTIEPKVSSFFNSTKKLLKKNTTQYFLTKNSSSNLDISSLNNINIENNVNNENKNNKKFIPSNISNKNIIPQNLRLSMQLPNNRRMSSKQIQLINIKKSNSNPSLLINNFQSKRRSCISMSNYNRFNFREKSLNKNNPINKKKSKPPNPLNPKNPIREIYEKINKNNISSRHKIIKNENLEKLLKKYYGEKINELNNNKKSDNFDLFRTYYKTKENIIEREKKDIIYVKYKEFLPYIMINKINKSKEQDEIIKGYPIDYVKSLYKNKFKDYQNKSI